MMRELLPLVRSGSLVLKPHRAVPLAKAEGIFRARGWEGDRKLLLTMGAGEV